MSAETYDAIIVGAGPAGSLCAGLLARRGRRVLLADKQRFPRPKVCGCCLSGRALRALDAAGARGALDSCDPVPLRRMTVACAGRSATLPMRTGAAVSRTALDAALADWATAQGAERADGARAELEPASDDQHRTVTLHTETRRDVPTRLVVAADGLRGRLLDDEPAMAWRIAPRSRIGAGATLDAAALDLPPGEVRMAVGDGGYVGLVRLEDGSIDAAAALDPRAVRDAGSPAALAARIVASAFSADPAPIESAAWKGTPALTRRRERIVGRRVVAIGDAAGYSEPLTGEGMGWAMASAVVSAPAMDRAIDAWNPGTVRALERTIRRAVGRRALSRAVSTITRRPRAASSVIGALAAAPALGRLAIDTTAREPRAARSTA